MIGVAAENLQAAFSTLAKLGSDPDVCLVDAVGSVQNVSESKRFYLDR